MEINIVYYTYINPKANYRIIITEQLRDIINSNIGTCAKLYIVISCDHPHLLDEVNQIVHNAMSNSNLDYVLEIENQNIFEYFGIKKIYDLAINEPNKYYVYLHGKGMYNLWGDTKPRVTSNIILTRGTINPWSKILSVFKENPNINVISMFPNDSVGWFNFWWASGKYLATCEPPKLCLDDCNRYYYEAWLGSGHKNVDSKNYNIMENNFHYYTAEEAYKKIIEMCNKF